MSIAAARVGQAQLTAVEDRRMISASVQVGFNTSSSDAVPGFAFLSWDRNVFAERSPTRAQAYQRSSITPDTLSAELGTNATVNSFGFDNPIRAIASSTFEMVVEVRYPVRLRVFGSSDQGGRVSVTSTAGGPALYEFDAVFDNVFFGQDVNLTPGQYTLKAVQSDDLTYQFFSLTRSRDMTFGASVVSCRSDFDLDGFVDDNDFVVFAADYNQFSCL